MNITDCYSWYKELTPPTKGVLEIIIIWSAHGVRRDLEYSHQCSALQAGPHAAASWNCMQAQSLGFILGCAYDV